MIYATTEDLKLHTKQSLLRLRNASMCCNADLSADSLTTLNAVEVVDGGAGVNQKKTGLAVSDGNGGYIVEYVSIFATLDEAKAAKKAELKAARDEAYDAGFDSDAAGETYHYDSDTDALARIGNAIGAVTDAGLPGIGWGCRDADGNSAKAMHTGDQLKAVRLAGMSYLDAVHAQYYSLKELVDLAESEEDLEAISW